MQGLVLGDWKAFRYGGWDVVAAFDKWTTHPAVRRCPGWILDLRTFQITNPHFTNPTNAHCSLADALLGDPLFARDHTLLLRLARDTAVLHSTFSGTPVD